MLPGIKSKDQCFSDTFAVFVQNITSRLQKWLLSQIRLHLQDGQAHLGMADKGLLSPSCRGRGKKGVVGGNAKEIDEDHGGNGEANDDTDRNYEHISTTSYSDCEPTEITYNNFSPLLLSLHRLGFNS